jgi:hypothetical protein
LPTHVAVWRLPWLSPARPEVSQKVMSLQRIYQYGCLGNHVSAIKRIADRCD